MTIIPLLLPKQAREDVMVWGHDSCKFKHEIFSVVLSYRLSIIRHHLGWDRPLACHFISALIISFKVLVLFKEVYNQLLCLCLDSRACFLTPELLWCPDFSCFDFLRGPIDKGLSRDDLVFPLLINVSFQVLFIFIFLKIY